MTRPLTPVQLSERHWRERAKAAEAERDRLREALDKLAELNWLDERLREALAKEDTHD